MFPTRHESCPAAVTGTALSTYFRLLRTSHQICRSRFCDISFSLLWPVYSWSLSLHDCDRPQCLMGAKHNAAFRDSRPPRFPVASHPFRLFVCLFENEKAAVLWSRLECLDTSGSHELKQLTEFIKLNCHLLSMDIIFIINSCVDSR